MLSNYPVFTPTEEEFANFAKFMASVEDKCKYHGCCKIIPPKSWRPNNYKTRDFAKLNIHIDTPIKQFTNEIAKGVYQQFHEEQPTGVTIQAFKDLSLNATKFIQPPDLTEDEDDDNVTTEKMDMEEEAEESSSKKRRSKRLKAKDWSQSQDASLATAPVITPMDNPYAHLVHNTLSRKQIDKIEQRYWASLKNTEFPAMYGADVPATVFDDQICKNWNLAHLDTMLYRKLKKANVLVPGINTPYLYIGMFKATFPWHTEDLELHSINYMHFGAPKTWYVIPPAHAEQFEQLVKHYFADSFKECDQFLRHKCVMIAPYVLQQHNIPYSRITQEVNQFVVTFPRSYHGGFNHAFNCAEAVNFATPSWIPIGKQAQVCRCIGDSVRIHMSMFEQQQQQPSDAAITEFVDPDMAHAMTGEQFEVIDDPYTQRGLQQQQQQPLDNVPTSNTSVRVKIKLNNAVAANVQLQEKAAPQPLVMKRKMMVATKKKKATTTTTTPQQAAMTSSFHIKQQQQQYTFHHHHPTMAMPTLQQQQQPMPPQILAYQQPYMPMYHQQQQQYHMPTPVQPPTLSRPPIPHFQQQQQYQQQSYQQQQQQSYSPVTTTPNIYLPTTTSIAPQQQQQQQQPVIKMPTVIAPTQQTLQAPKPPVKVTIKKPIAPATTSAPPPQPQAPLKMMSPELAEKLAKQKQQMGIQKKSKSKQQDKKKKLTSGDKLLQVLLA